MSSKTASLIIAALAILSASAIPSALALTATGGNMTTDGTYQYHIYNSTGAYTFNVLTAPASANKIEILIIGGGGGGAGDDYGGGGGAGGYVNDSDALVGVATYTVFVGDGGAGGISPNTNGTSGQNSYFNLTIYQNFTAYGGGYGAYANNLDGWFGGSGGGAGCNNANGGPTNQTSVLGTTGFGNNGGNCVGSAGGGGGGAGSAGGNDNAKAGEGKISAITGSNKYYAWGGNGSTTGTGKNATASQNNTGQGGNAGTNVVNGQQGGTGIVIIRYPLPSISITTPTNSTYYNNPGIILNTSSIAVTISSWFYSLNGLQNISFNPGSNITATIGSNCVTIWANDTLNNWYKATSCFTYQINCSILHVEESTCTPDGSGIMFCKRLGLNIFQWNFTNVTLCPYGCYNSTCIVPAQICQNKCTLNDTICEGSKQINCSVNPATGCLDWINQTDCKFGCSRQNGRCNSQINICQPYTMQCQDSKYVVWCLDENHDGIFAWSIENRTVCPFQCIENITASNVVAYCTSHSLTDETAAIRIMWNYYSGMIFYALGGNQRLFIGASVIIIFLITFAVGILTRSWIIGAIGMFVSMLALSSLNMFPWTISVAIILIGGYIVFKYGAGGNNE